jgi:hypothetical protein
MDGDIAAAQGRPGHCPGAGRPPWGIVELARERSLPLAGDRGRGHILSFDKAGKGLEARLPLSASADRFKLDVALPGGNALGNPSPDGGFVNAEARGCLGHRAETFSQKMRS